MPVFVVLFAMLVMGAFAADAVELEGDQWVGHDPRTGVWTMPDGRTFYYGDPADQPIMCDWDGDEIDTVGLYRSRTGFLHLRQSNSQGFSDIQIFYGIPEDQPVCGDWDGDGIDTIGVYRPSERRFYLRNSNTQGFADFDFDFLEGIGTPVAGDWNGDGVDTVGLYDGTRGLITLAAGNTSAVASVFSFGEPGDSVIAGDWNDDGVDTFGVIRGTRAFLSMPSGIVELEANIPGNPIAARVSPRVPNGIITSPTGGVSLIRGDSLRVSGTAFSSRPVSLSWRAVGPSGFELRRTGQTATLGPMDDAGIWTIILDAHYDNGVSDPTPAELLVNVESAPEPEVQWILPAPNTEFRVGGLLDLEAHALGVGPLSYVWSFPGSTIASLTGPDPAPFALTSTGALDIELSVTDRFGQETATSFNVVVAPNAAPEGTIQTPSASTVIPRGSSVTFSGSGTDPDGDTMSFRWVFTGSPAMPDVIGPDPAAVTFASSGSYTVTLHVTDQSGLSDPTPPSVTVTIFEPGAILISPGEDIQAIIDANPGPNTFVLGPGVHRGQSVRPYDHQTIVGANGAVLSGARVLTAWQYDAGYNAWFVDGQTQQGRVTAEWVASGPVCRDTNPRCRYPEDLFIDGEIQRHVTWIGDLAEDTWWFDYGADKIWVKNDPRNRFVETSVVGQGIFGGADHVTVRNLIIEKFATPTQVGAIDSRLYATMDGPDGTNWTIENVEARYNHGTGIFLTDGGRIRNSYAHHNGQQGFSARGHDVVVENSELSHNNTVGYHWDFESGGGKYYRTYDMVFRNNHVHHNYGSGVWFDIANFNALIEGNTVEYNDFDGIFYEVSYGAVIRNNVVTGNGFLDARGVWLWGAGIVVASSSDVEIYANEVRDNWNGITAVEQQRGTWEGNPREVTNLWVHDNVVSMDASLITHNHEYNIPANGYTGLGVDYGDTSFYTSRGNRFTSNDYEMPAGASLFHWRSIPRDWPTWHLYGQDLEGTMTYVGVYTP